MTFLIIIGVQYIKKLETKEARKQKQFFFKSSLKILDRVKSFEVSVLTLFCILNVFKVANFKAMYLCKWLIIIVKTLKPTLR